MNDIETFEIVSTISTEEWQPKGIWKRLKKGFEDGIGGTKEAIKEAYAVVTSDITTELEHTSAFGLHHEVRDDGKIVLNKFALQKAVAELDKAKTLTEEQAQKAKAHLLRHYAELEEEPPLSLVQGEMSLLQANIGGTIKPEDIPVAPGVDIESIKDGDDDPLEVVVDVPVSHSTRGWFYTGECLQDIVDFVNENTLSGFLGHQKPEDIGDEFPTPVTHWIGARWEPSAPVLDKNGEQVGEGKAYFRGIVDKVAPDLKRWIRSKRVTQVSIFGVPELTTVNGETHVVGYNPLSIDWTPLHRAGMPTQILATGEMNTFDGSLDSLKEIINTAVYNKYRTDDVWCWVEKIFEDYVILTIDGKDGPEWFKINYSIVDNEVVLSKDKTALTKKIVYEEKEGGKEDMTLQEMLASIRNALAKNEIELVNVLGEIGFTSEELVEKLAGEQIQQLTTGAEFGVKLSKVLGFNEESQAEDVLTIAGEMKGVWEALGFDKEKPENPAEVVGEMVESRNQRLQAEQEKLVKETIEEKVAGEQAQALVAKLLKVADGATKEQIAGEIDGLLADDVIKGVIGKSYVDGPIAKGTGEGDKTPKTLVTRTVSI